MKAEMLATEFFNPSPAQYTGNQADLRSNPLILRDIPGFWPSRGVRSGRCCTRRSGRRSGRCSTRLPGRLSSRPSGRLSTRLSGRPSSRFSTRFSTRFSGRFSGRFSTRCCTGFSGRRSPGRSSGGRTVRSPPTDDRRPQTCSDFCILTSAFAFRAALQSCPVSRLRAGGVSPRGAALRRLGT